MQSVTDHDHGGLAANCRMKVMIASTGAPVPVHDVAEVRSKRRALFTFSKRNDVPIRRVAKVGNHSSIPGVNPRPMHQCFVGHILSDEDFLSPALLRCRRQKPCSGLPRGKTIDTNNGQPCRRRGAQCSKNFDQQGSCSPRLELICRRHGFSCACLIPKLAKSYVFQ